MALTAALVVTGVAVNPASASTFERIGAITLGSGENSPTSVLVDPDGAFAYFATFTVPGRVVKVDLSTFERVGALTFETGEGPIQAGVIDPEGDFAYFGTYTSPGRVVKVDLSTFERVGSLTFESGESQILSAVMAPDGAFAYFGTADSPGKVVKVDLSTFQRVGALELDEQLAFAAAMDPSGAAAYFGSNPPGSEPGLLIKVDLVTFQQAATVELVPDLVAAGVDPTGSFAYVATYTTPARVLKVDLSAFTLAGTLTLEAGDDYLRSMNIDPAGAYAYAGALFGRVVRVDLATFERLDAVTLASGENPWSAGMDSSGEFMYVGTASSPGKVVKIATPTPVIHVDVDGPITSLVELAPNPVAVGTDVTISALIDDASTGESEISAAEYSLNGGAFQPLAPSDGLLNAVTEAVSGTIPGESLPLADVHEVCVRGTDAALNSGAVACAPLAVYDPAAGFATGAGLIESPAGAYAPDPDAVGQARFAFVSKYKKGLSVPDGQTKFTFLAGDLKFESTGYEYLIVNQNGSRAQFKGTGTINGGGSYSFIVWAEDGDPDRFRIKIWDETETTVYDNGSEQPISAGKISIHAT